MENLCSSKSEEEVFETFVKLAASLAETKEDVQKIHKLTVEAGQSTRRDGLPPGGNVSADGEQLDAWLAAVQASHLEAFESFVTGVQQDKGAVLVRLSWPWSNGPLEGNVNRLKLIKRSMYGRAEVDLLKLRVLHHSKKSQDRKNKKNKKQGQQGVHLKKPKIMKNGANSQHTTTGISKVA